MKHLRAITLILTPCLISSIFRTPVLAGRRVKPLNEQLAAREILETPQDKTIRLGEDGKPRVIITSDLEIDDMNSFIHECLFFNQIDLAGIVVSDGSSFHGTWGRFLVPPECTRE